MDKIAKVFLWASTLVGLILLIIGGVSLVNLGLKQWVFTKADSQQCAYIQPVPAPVTIGSVSLLGQSSSTAVQQCQDQQSAQKQTDAATATAELLVGAPVFLFFFKKARQN